MKQETGQKHSGWYLCCVVLAGFGMLLVVLAVMVAREVNGGMWAALGALLFGNPLTGSGETTIVAMGAEAGWYVRVLWSARFFLYGMSLLVLALPGVLKEPPRRLLMWVGLCLAGVEMVALLVVGLWQGRAAVLWATLFAIPLVVYMVFAALRLRAGNKNEMPAGLQAVSQPKEGEKHDEGTEQ